MLTFRERLHDFRRLADCPFFFKLFLFWKHWKTLHESLETEGVSTTNIFYSKIAGFMNFQLPVFTNFQLKLKLPTFFS